MLSLIGLAITFFLAVILWGKRHKANADYVLLIWLLLIGVHLGFYYSVASGKYLQFPYLLGVEIPLPLAYGPLLYLYTSELTRPTHRRRYRLLHFVPLVLAYLYIIPFYVLTPARKIWVYQHEGEGFRERQLLLLCAIVLSGVSYALASWLRLQRHRKRIDAQFSNTEKINLAWLRYLIAGISVIWLTIFLDNEAYIFGAVVTFVCFIGYFGIRQMGIFTDQSRLAWEEGNAPTHGASASLTAEAAESEEPVTAAGNAAQDTAVKSKYARSGLSQGVALLIYENLETLMMRERLFTYPELTLVQLSEKLGTNANHLSQVINMVGNKSFYDYINALRIAEFTRIAGLPENQKYTLLHLALECGFNSKTSFNRNFRKHTGLSPSEFLAQQNIHLQ
ncbi:helix-turn-helix domain-containing protein [Dyadobacter fermentans]|uniref:helix-turn-helix domain-containing protein n=1 Tax=Dyadobacter fermentans TaxID=94254 RepID=UPI001CBC3A46|nr:helix-turn-helix domain-containing protein [Dyadobacter fermentans]MBZ1358018.1 helix-turn-helix domain-containing protein [Dyadobacter fermentans]